MCLFRYEATRVVVAVGARVAKGFEDGVGLEELVLDAIDLAALGATDCGDVLHNVLGCLGLAGTRLACGLNRRRVSDRRRALEKILEKNDMITRDDDALIALVRGHVAVRIRCDGVDVRGQLIDLAAAVQLDVVRLVDHGLISKKKKTWSSHTV